ncbi:HNH endonuclease [Clostridioides difficile]|uniref:HNH endonuclease n=1 Tax=Clostridioides difficile TaxID=1496 RepID=UPI0014423F26|nr:HNH endonuclease signature motif containing protein [Clostridioides difficile]EKJ1812056.1 HNH endonuclease [Clostridioides difficile]MCR1392147.1 HNH endonuclease [Clostridioides difficile]NKN22159.1 HNH endonuclease [Clostridioides difficile]HCQ5901285.1 HNH endonuclease [Clostridioides difficile]
MAREFSRSFYNSKAWKECRQSIIKKYLGLCAECGKLGEEVHHIKYLTPANIHDAEITLSEDNLILLCKDCHSKKHKNNKDVTRTGLKFNENGELISI